MSEILEEWQVKADLYVIGGATMALAYEARPSTRDVDAVFKRKNEVYKAAAQVAREQTLPDGWLSDAAKKFMGRPDKRPLPVLDLPGLRLMAGSQEYLLAMKVLADRHDRDRGDLKFLIGRLGLKSIKQVEKLFTEVYPNDGIAQDTRARIVDLLSEQAVPQAKSRSRSG